MKTYIPGRSLIVLAILLTIAISRYSQKGGPNNTAYNKYISGQGNLVVYASKEVSYNGKYKVIWETPADKPASRCTMGGYAEEWLGPNGQVLLNLEPHTLSDGMRSFWMTCYWDEDETIAYVRVKIRAYGSLYFNHEKRR